MRDSSFYHKRALQREIDRRGGYCQNNSCDFTNWEMQFAHLRPTGLKGQGRGRNRRIQDIIKHATAYALLCRLCHMAFDRGDELVLIVRADAIKQ